MYVCTRDIHDRRLKKELKILFLMHMSFLIHKNTEALFSGGKLSICKRERHYVIFLGEICICVLER